jgi:hypothetical protein
VVVTDRQLEQRSTEVVEVVGVVLVAQQDEVDRSDVLGRSARPISFTAEVPQPNP